MDFQHKATRIKLFDLRSVPMRTFHMTWFAFFLCFFAWFGIAPLMAVVREELSLTQAQVGNTIIASVAVTVFARILIGWFCDHYGPRRTYSVLLMVGALPVMGIGLAHDYMTFLLFRLAIGVIGAAFVITQYHTSVMFAPNIVGTANATTAGWGNLGGGVTQMIMPLIFGAFLTLGFSEFWGWRLAMVTAGAICFVTGIVYYFVTQDSPDGNYSDLRELGSMAPKSQTKTAFLVAARDPRAWALFLIYGACFGVELTINNVAALYFKDYFDLSLKNAGMVAGLFGLMNIFARTVGGAIADRFGARWGLAGRVRWLFIALFIEGLGLVLFSRMTVFPLAFASLIFFSMFVQASEGATFSVVPFISKRALGAVAGIVGAGGNFGAVMAGFLFKGYMTWPNALMTLGIVVICSSFLAFLVRFSEEDEREVAEEIARRLEAAREGAA